MMPSSESPFVKFTGEATRIVEEAEKRGITLRILGATAVRLHCRKFGTLLDVMERAPTDLDFMTYAKYRSVMRDFFVEMGYVPDDRIITLHGYRRHIYHGKEDKVTVDVFFDNLEFCHTIRFQGRLELDSPTITLADLLLAKMQIVRLNEKDVKDVIVMLKEHDVGDVDKETINADYIARTLSDDWGYYYTFTTNMNKVTAFLKEFPLLDEAGREEVLARTEKLVSVIESYPKTLKWKMRARVGTSRKWYNEVEDFA